MDELSNGWQRTDTMQTQRNEASGRHMHTTLAITPLKHTVYIPDTMLNTTKTLPAGRPQYPPKGILHFLLIWG